MRLTKAETAWLKRHLKDQRAFFYTWAKSMAEVTES